MSIANVYLPRDRQRVLCVCDTLVAINGVPAGHGPKFLLLPHVSTALLFRGSNPFMWLMGSAVSSNYYDDFEHLVSRLPQMCRTAAEWHAGTLAALDGASAPEVVAVGPSAITGGFAAVSYTYRDGWRPVAQEPGLSLRPAPAGYFLPASDVEPTTDDLVRVAEMQMAQLRVDIRECTGSGGALTLIAFGHDGEISTRVIGWLAPNAGPLAEVQPSAWWARTFAQAPGMALQ